jgi:hypothetical protein
MALLLVADVKANTWLDINLASIHGRDYWIDYDGTRHPFNETNLGLGISHSLTQYISIGGGFYDNSFNKLTTYWGGEIHTSTYRNWQLGVAGAYLTGYEDTPMKSNALVLPTVTYEYKLIRVKVGYLPITDPTLITFQLGVKLQ